MMDRWFCILFVYTADERCNVLSCIYIVLSCVFAEDCHLLNVALAHANSSVKSRACFLLGNMLKHSSAFYSSLAEW